MLLYYSYKISTSFDEIHHEEYSQIQRDQACRCLCLRNIVRTLRIRVQSD